jgi:hypothetical protein
MAWLTNISTLTQSLQAAAEQATDVVRAVGLDGHLVSRRQRSKPLAVHEGLWLLSAAAVHVGQLLQHAIAYCVS